MIHVHTSKGRWVAVSAATLIGGLPAMPVWAQTESLEEVVVTARKRNESVRDVPITESVFTEQAIESAGIQKPGDFISLVPNMTLVETQNAGTSFVVVRHRWSVTSWSKNLTGKKYNAEFSPGGFLFKALPRRYGVDFNYRF
jgi:hypothetical protein